MNDRKIRALLDRRARLQAEVRGLDEAIERWERAQVEAMVLSKPAARATVNNMFTSHALATSAGKGKGDPMIVALNAAGYSVRSIAPKVGATASAISMARRGDRPIKRAVAEKIQQLTRYKATGANWPGGIVD